MVFAFVDTISITLETLLVYIFLKETLNNKYQLFGFGFVFVVIGAVFMNVGDTLDYKNKKNGNGSKSSNVPMNNLVYNTKYVYPLI